jgi:3-phenylpropionate/trans-cinnamate dioxygenase ferredoxin reductase component
MSSIERIVIIGAGLAGARAAEALRKDGYEGRITLLGDEPDRPYIRPPLSKEYLRGESARDKVFVHPEGFYVENGIDLRSSTTAQAIDRATREVVVDDDGRIPFDRLLIATGARPRTLPLPGADLPGVVTLRTLADAEALRTAAEAADRIVIIGAGWIGSEVAASLRMLGRRVTMVAPDSIPLERVLGPEVGAVYRDLHEERGVAMRLGTSVARIMGSDRVEAVETAAGDRIAADLVVVGIGVEPRTELAASAGLKIDNGIEVSATLQTSDPGIFAAGDVASAWHPFYDRRLRSEHWANAKFQGSAAGPLMLGAEARLDRLPYFYSDQFDLGMEYTGHASGTDRLVVRGSLAERAFVAFWLVDGRVVAGMNANVWDVAKPMERLIRSRAVVDVDALADPSIPVDELVAPDDAPQVEKQPAEQRR